MITTGRDCGLAEWINSVYLREVAALFTHKWKLFKNVFGKIGDQFFNIALQGHLLNYLSFDFRKDACLISLGIYGAHKGGT